MNSEKVKEIKKALECCAKGLCGKNCPRFDKKHININCQDEMNADILTYINELESENEKLQRGYVVRAYDELRAENNKLRNQIHCQIVLPDEKLEEIKKECLERVEADVTEALKQFAERLKEKVNADINRMYALRIDGVGVLCDFIDKIDETLKEFNDD